MRQLQRKSCGIVAVMLSAWIGFSFRHAEPPLSALTQERKPSTAGWSTDLTEDVSSSGDIQDHERSQLVRPLRWQPAWQVKRGQPGYPLVADCQHFVVQAPDLTVGAYQHHPQLIWSRGSFFAAWSSHPIGEDGPGQSVRMAHSADGMRWSSSQELFPPVDVIADSDRAGLILMACPFMEVGDRLFASAVVCRVLGFTATEDQHLQEVQSTVRDPAHPIRVRQGAGFLVRELRGPDDWGSIHWLNLDGIEPPSGLPPDVEELLPEELIASLQGRLTDPRSSPPWRFDAQAPRLETSTGEMLVEPTVVEFDEGKWIRLWRANGDAQVLFQQSSVDGQTWTEPIRTDIPDAPSKSQLGRLPSGTVYLLGNQVRNLGGTRRDPLTIGLTDDGEAFDVAFAVRWRTPPFRIPNQRDDIKGSDGRGRGYQYPSGCVVEDHLWVIYSVNKEAIDVSRLSLQALQAQAAQARASLPPMASDGPGGGQID